MNIGLEWQWSEVNYAVSKKITIRIDQKFITTNLSKDLQITLIAV